MPYRFAPAASGESIVHGARRPAHPRLGTPDETVEDWLTFVDGEGIERVCCLLDARRLHEYEDLLTQYRTRFGSDHVCHAPIRDFTTTDADLFHHRIRPFLVDADLADEPVVVHCSAGSGRTGHVLALWLAAERGYELEGAIEAVSETGRNPLEATTLEGLRNILNRK